MKKILRFLVPLLLALVIIASIVWYLFVYDRAFTRDTLLSQARFNDLHGNAQLSSMFYDLAYSFSGHDENVAVELANQYKEQGNFTKAEYTLTHAINQGATKELYQNLCKTYVQQDKLLDAVNLLETMADTQIKAELDAQRPAAPQPDHKAGYYSTYMDIHLHSSDGAAIFYTTDGSYPSTKGSAYSGGIPLPAGETTIYAIAVNADGLVSPVTVLGYTVTGVVEEAQFTDPVMEQAMRDAIQAGDSRTIYTNDLWEITEFTVPEGVESYQDLSLLSYVKKLTITEQTMDSLAPLASLSVLEELDLTGTTFPIEDMPTLAQLPGLKKLVLASGGISTISDLAGATGLTYLDLSSNTIRNLEVLEGMTNLSELYLQNNAVKDLNHVGVLPNLTRLDVSYNAISTLAPLAGCSQLRWLAADHNQLTALNGLEDAAQLTHLSVNANSIKEVALLQNCTALKELNIGSNDIESVSALRALTNLETFNLSNNHVTALPDWPQGSALITINGSYNQLTTIDVLKRMENLTHVYMDYNLLTNIDALADNFCLVQVNVFGNEISDVSKLREHDIIVNYDPTK